MYYLIKDESFEIQKSKDYILSIQVCLDGFSFLMLNPDKKRIVAYKNNPVLISSYNLVARRLKEWLESEELLKNQFKSVRSFIFTENFTLVPSGYSGSEWHRNLTSALFDKKIHNHFTENKIDKPDANLLFPVSQDIITVLHHFFDKNVEIIHPVTNLLNTSFESKKATQSVILSTKKYFYLVIFNNNKLILANSFPTAHQNDLVYNVVNSFQQLDLTRSETEMFMAGSNDQNAEIKTSLKPFFQNISNLKIEDIVSNPEIIYNSLQLYLALT